MQEGSLARIGDHCRVVVEDRRREPRSGHGRDRLPSWVVNLGPIGMANDKSSATPEQMTWPAPARLIPPQALAAAICQPPPFSGTSVLMFCD